MHKYIAVRVAGAALTVALGGAVAAAPAAAAPSATQVAAKAIDWRDVSASAAAVGDSRNSKAALWVVGKHAAKPAAADKGNVRQAVLAASSYGDVAEPIVTDATNPSFSAAADSSNSSSNGSSGSSTGSSGSANGSLGGPVDISYDELKAILATYFANFDWSQVTIPLITAVLQAQGVPLAIATPLAQLIWQVVERTFPAYAR